MYDRTYWKDHVVAPDNTYAITKNEDGTFTITPVGDVMQQGTPQDQTHFNNIELGVSDSHTEAYLLINSVRQTVWRVDALEDATVQEVGTVALSNSLKFPFNNSQQSVALEAKRDNLNYIVVIVNVAGEGNVGEVEVTDRLENGFKISYTGSASSATITYAVIGGYER